MPGSRASPSDLGVATLVFGRGTSMCDVLASLVNNARPRLRILPVGVKVEMEVGI